MRRASIGTWMLLLVAVLSFITALIPVLNGRPMNVTFFAVGMVWLILALAMAAKTRKR
jgi:hypothetical protein